VIVIGYGPAGQDTVRCLREREIPFLVLEMNPNTVRANPQVAIELGDATQREILQHVGLGQCLGLVVTTPDPATAAMVCQTARTLDANVPIVVRARYHISVAAIKAAGANSVIDEEHLIGGRLADELISLVNR
jgi:monovalent cation:H+ antiporter-2, CPA2 family